MTGSDSFEALVDAHASQASAQKRQAGKPDPDRLGELRECDEVVIEAVAELRRRGIRPNSVASRAVRRRFAKYLPLAISHPTFRVWVLPPLAIAADASAYWLGARADQVGAPRHGVGYPDWQRRRIGSEDVPSGDLRAGTRMGDPAVPLTPDNLRVALAGAIGKILADQSPSRGK